MAGEFLQLIDSAQRQSAQTYAQVDAAMTRSMNLRLQAINQQSEQTMKAFQFAEAVRMNDIQAEGIKMRNQLEASKLEFQKQLLPMQLENERIKLESSKFNIERQKRQDDQMAFNSITKQWDDTIGFDFLNNNNAQMIDEYNEFKAKAMGSVLNGSQFDVNSYERGVNDIRSRYKDQVVDPTEYNPQVESVLSRVSPTAAQRYAQKNPVFARNKNAIASVYLSTPPEKRGEFMEKYSPLWEGDNEGLGQLALSADVYQGNNLEIEKAYDELRRANTAILAIDHGREDSASEYERLKGDAESIVSRISRLREENRNIQSNVISGMSPLEVIDKRDAYTKPDISKHAQSSGEPVFGVGIPSVSSSARPFYDRLTMVSEILTRDLEDKGSSEIANIYLPWFAERARDRQPDVNTLKDIRNRTEEQIRARGDVEDRMSATRIDSLLQSIDGSIEVPISDFAAKIFSRYSPGFITGYRSSGDLSGIPGDTFLKLDSNKATAIIGDSNRVRSISDLHRVLDRVTSSAERRELMEELYAAIITGATAAQVKDR